MAAGTKADVLIVGGGIAGCATAWFLAREGADVILIERDDISSRASGRNAGGLHAQLPHQTTMERGLGWARHFSPIIGVLVESIGLWRGLQDEHDLDVTIGGGLLVAGEHSQMREIEERIAIEHAVGLDIRVLDRSELRHLAPYISDAAVGGAFCPLEGKANPLKAVPAFARLALASGARLMRRTELVSLERNGAAFSARTTAGIIAARRVVNCAGIDAGRVAAMVGIPLPIHGEAIMVSVTEPVEPLVNHLVYSAGHLLTLKQGSNGSLLIGGGWPARTRPGTADPVIDLAALAGNLAAAQAVVPRIAKAALLRSWAGYVNGTPDWRPIVGEAPRVPGFFNQCFPYFGFTAGPLSALVTAELVLGRKPSVDIERYSVLRDAA
jgi:glycine/D-amino acid oxidase-like deaminating enzyme